MIEVLALADEKVSEIELCDRALQGDREAFAEIVRCNRAGMINVIYRMCGDTCLAEDAAQVAFIKAWQQLATYKPVSSLRSWLYRIAINSALDMLRRESSQVDLDTTNLASPGNELEKLVEQQERCAQVQKAVLSLPEASRAVLVLREYEGLSYREISQALDIPPGTVMSRLNYARTRLMELLRPYLLEET